MVGGILMMGAFFPNKQDPINSTTCLGQQGMAQYIGFRVFI
jgi:hypothetical protein